MDLLQWLQPKIPLVYSIVTECGKDQPFKIYYTADPAMIWGDPGLTRVFLVNCHYQFIQLDGNAEKTAENVDKDTPLLSTVNCESEKENPFIDPRMREYHKLNQLLICDRTETEKFIYTYSD
ncbi:MAG: hypothetical protein UY13_C0002G0317 [Candidatus Pacebacteria bacterium GW2011_GWB1_47_8]|nr:MAG: hypothetical protein UX28_C0001G0465 [Candidatus Pacebacteria bacterium GW2011_GWA1_46_10]KKU84405.1 MAG: hypothetical protein UY13_C0002G0317 [Candidatus Pacebacteria bacterium GW2011_GWB1_47_8]HCR81166.1 hypothetical protein [Candidatus Paceibacterota bacterium]